MKFSAIFYIIISISSYSNAEYTWQKKTYSMEQHLDKLEKQSEEKADWILKEVNRILNEEKENQKNKNLKEKNND